MPNGGLAAGKGNAGRFPSTWRQMLGVEIS